MAQPNPLHLALETLLPRISNGKIPPRVLNMATSLHGQSHQKLPSLKPEEEIARPYVCAEIAVNKLQYVPCIASFQYLSSSRLPFPWQSISEARSGQVQTTVQTGGLQETTEAGRRGPLPIDTAQIQSQQRD